MDNIKYIVEIWKKGKEASDLYNFDGEIDEAINFICGLDYEEIEVAHICDNKGNIIYKNIERNKSK